MPKRTDIKSVLIIGAGPIIIGQACEFDYSGAQACKALREEGYRVILVNSNPATIMTDPRRRTSPTSNPSHGRLLNASLPRSVPTRSCRQWAGRRLSTARWISLDTECSTSTTSSSSAPSRTQSTRPRTASGSRKPWTASDLNPHAQAWAYSLREAKDLQAKFGFPTVIRPSFTLGGSGGGIAHDMESFIEICERGLELSPTHELLIEESLLGWKEYEMEVVRDTADNCIIVCSIENFDPMGVHTGDSITVAPAQTLTDREYQRMRDASIAILREIGVDTGGSNVQFAVNPETGRMIVIEMNPRVSRSSALASKATASRSPALPPSSP